MAPGSTLVMHFHFVTLFPDSFGSYFNESILKRSIEDKKIKVSFYNPRDFTKDKHARVDRSPYGGGPGMVIQAEPVIKAIEKARGKKKDVKIIFLSPRGKQFSNEYAENLAKKFKHIIFVCGRYEGIDARVRQVFSRNIDEISIGPFVLTGGELPAMLITDVVARQVEGVLGNVDSIEERRVAGKDVYTRPEVFTYKGKKYAVPKILLSGHHKNIEDWRKSLRKS